MEKEMKKMQVTTQALVLREVIYKETDKILTLLSEDLGKITVIARGCLKRNSPKAAGCQQLVWGEFVLTQLQTRWSVKEVSIDMPFTSFSQDIFRLSLACYFAEVGEVLSTENSPQDDLLSLLLNCLYALDQRKNLPMSMVKAVFELRAACQSGYEPLLDGCSHCYVFPPNHPQLALELGTIHCYACGGKGFPLSDSTLAALYFVTQAPPKKIFQFVLDQYDDLGALSEQYLLTQLDRPFKTLDFYKKLNAI